MNYFRFITIALLLLSLISISPKNSNASVLADEESLKLLYLSKPVIDTEKMRTVEISKLDEAYMKKIELEDFYDIQAGEILHKITNQITYYDKTISTTKNDKIEAMHKIIDIFESTEFEVKDRDFNLLLRFLLKYAPYSNDTSLIVYQSNLKSAQMNEINVLNSSFNRTDAVNYAYSYWTNYNTPTYPDLNQIGGDCANFVSQSLHYGGKSMIGSWYINRKNTDYITPSTIAQLNHSWSLADPSPWISAKEFEIFWINNSSHSEWFDASYVANNQSIIYNKPYYRGDVIQIMKKRYWWYEGYHTMLITDYGSGDFLLTYHTDNRKDRPLNVIAQSYNSSDYKFRFYGIN